MKLHQNRPRLIGLAFALATLASCGAKEDATESGTPTSSGHAEAEAAVDPSRIAVPSSVRANLGITFVTVERRRVEQTSRIPGQFEYMPSARREYRTMLPGRVELLVKQFQRVEAGQPLFRVASPAWHGLQQQLSETESAAESLETRIQSFDGLVAAHQEHESKLRDSISVLQRRMEQLEKLGEAGGGRVTELANARAALAAAGAQLAGAREEATQLVVSKKADLVQLRGTESTKELLLRSMATLLGSDAGDLTSTDGEQGKGKPRWRTLDSLIVTAADAGVVQSLSMTDGAWADERALVLSVVRPELLRFRAMGLQSDLGLLQDGLDVRIVPPVPTNVDRAIGLQDSMPGKLSLGLAADADSRTVELYVVPEELASWARSGVAAQLEIVRDSTASPEIAVPLAAVQQDGLQAALFRRNPSNPNEVIRIEGDLGPNDGRWVSVLSGLRDGDEVVLDGSFQLMLATSGSMQKGGHFHADGTFHEGED